MISGLMALYGQNPFSNLVDGSVAVCNIDDVVENSAPIEMPDSTSFDMDYINALDTMMMGVFERMCGSYTFRINNPFILRFYGGSNSGEIDLNITNCSEGVQIALLEDYVDPKVIYCNSERILGSNIKIPADGLKPNHEYFLLIDGFGGNACDVSFNSLDGFENYPPLDEEGIAPNAESMVTGCAGSNIVFDASEFFGPNLASSWKIYKPNGQLILEEESLTATLTAVLDEGDYTAEFVLITPCDSTEGHRFDFTIDPIASETLEPFTYCRLDFPNINHQDTRVIDPVPAPVNDTIFYQIIDENNCPYIIKIPIEEQGQSTIESFDVVYCGAGPHLLGDFEITKEYDDERVLVTDAMQQCDSSIMLTASILYIEGKIIQESCNAFRFNYDVLPNIQNLDQFNYQWSNNGVEIESGSGIPLQINIETPGTIALTIEMEKSDKNCNFETELEAELKKIQAFCEGYDESIEVTWEDIQNIGYVELYKDGELIQTTSDQKFDVVSDSDNEVHNLHIVAHLNDGCVLESDILNCQSYNCPTNDQIFYSISSRDEIICPSMIDPNYTFRGYATGPLDDAEYYWTGVPGISPDGMIDVDSIEINTYQAYIVYENKYCRYQSPNVLFEVIDDLDANYDLLSEVCVGDAVPLNYLGVNADNLFYDLDVQGEYTLLGESLKDIEILWTKPGIYNVELQVKTADCVSDVVRKSIIVKEREKVNSIRSNANRQSILFDWDPIACAQTYAIYLDGKKYKVQADLDFVYLPQDFDNKQFVDFQVGIEESTCECPGLSTTIRESTIDRPNVRIDITDPGVICMNSDTEPIQLDLNIKGSEEDGIVFWTGNGINNAGIFDPIAAGLGQHKLIVNYRESNNYLIRDSIVINVEESPELTYEFTNPECGQEKGTLYLTTENESIDIFINDQMVMDSELPIEPGFHYVEFVSPNGCVESENFNVIFPPRISGNIIGPSRIQENASQNYAVETFGDTELIDSIVWELLGQQKILCHDCPSTFAVTMDVSDRLCAKIYYADICTETICTDIVVTEKNTIAFPNAFASFYSAPDNRFKPFSTDDLAMVEELTIYNRQGTKVYQTSDQMISDEDYLGWDGRFDNSYVEQGVYIYHAIITNGKGESSSVEGSVTFMK